MPERRVAEAVHGAHARRGPGDRAHLRLGLRVDEQMQVDPRVRPVPQRRQVGDRRDHGHAERAGAAQPPQDLARARIGRDDDVRGERGNGAQQPAVADDVDGPGAEATGRRPLRHEAVPDVEGDVARARLELRGAAGQRPRHAAGGRQPVDHLRPRAALAQRGRQQPRREVVALADRGRDDQDARQKTTVVAPLSSTRSSQWRRTARMSTVRSMSAPSRAIAAVSSECETRMTSCSMIGPSSSCSVT